MKPITVLIPLLAMLCGCDENPALEWQRKEEARDAVSAKVQADITELNRRFDALERRVMEMPPNHAQKMAWEIVQMYDVLRRNLGMKQQTITINGVDIDVAKVLEDTLKKMVEGDRQ